VACVLYTIKHM